MHIFFCILNIFWTKEIHADVQKQECILYISSVSLLILIFVKDQQSLLSPLGFSTACD